jgi:hypothetical protein
MLLENVRGWKLISILKVKLILKGRKVKIFKFLSSTIGVEAALSVTSFLKSDFGGALLP